MREVDRPQVFPVGLVRLNIRDELDELVFRYGKRAVGEKGCIVCVFTASERIFGPNEGVGAWSRTLRSCIGYDSSFVASVNR